MKWVVKVESDLVSIEHFRTKGKANSVEYDLAIVSFTLKKAISPEEGRDIAELIKAYIKEFVKPQTSEIVVLSGRAPIWLYMMMQHQLQHIVGALAVFDPKVGVIVTASHRYDTPSEATVIEIDAETRARLTQ